MAEPRIPSWREMLNDCCQVRVTFNRRTGELLIRSLPRNEDMAFEVLETALKEMRRDRYRRHYLNRALDETKHAVGIALGEKRNG